MSSGRNEIRHTGAPCFETILRPHLVKGDWAATRVGVYGGRHLRMSHGLGGTK